MLPFTTDQFFAVFARYNTVIWPIQLVGYLLGALAVSLLFHRSRLADRVIAGVLSLMWLWTGVVYHGLFFSTINPAAFPFAVMFVIEACAIAWSGVLHHRLRFGWPSSRPAAWIGGGLVVYAAALYPLIGLARGHGFGSQPMFGVTPCPVTLFTIGMLLLTTVAPSRWLLVIPVLWALIGGSAAVLLRVTQDWPLLASGLGAVVVFSLLSRRAGQTPR